MNVNSTLALSCELKSFDAPVLSTNDLWFSWLKPEFLKYFENCLTAIEITLGVHEKFKKQKNIYIITNTKRA